MQESVLHYNNEYYETHYKHIAENEKYYKLLSEYSKFNLFEQKQVINYRRVLDFGAGLGYVTAGLGKDKVDYYDPSPIARDFLLDKGFNVYQCVQEIESDSYDIIISSHALEHSLNPYADLLLFRSFLIEKGKLILILPIEKIPGQITFNNDDNKHFFCWNFQTISNLLIEAGYKILHQSIVYGPFGLQKTGNLKLAYKLGQLFKCYPSLYILAENLSDG
jgi:SAM-dependent methyltransferase